MSLSVKNMLGGGKSEGLYAWIKKKWIPPIIAENPSMSISASKNGTSDYKYIQISSADFDYTQIEGDYKEFFNGFKKSSGSYYFTVNDGYLYLYIDSSLSLQITDFDKSKGIFTMGSIYSRISATVSYSGSKTVKDGASGDTIDYIVSDKENAYPDGGEKGGYWYEKVGGAKVATGEITFSSAVDSITIEHGLGKEPKSIFLINIYKDTSTKQTAVAGAYKNGTDSKIIATMAFSDGTNGFKPGADTSGYGTYDDAVITADINNIYVPISYKYESVNKYLGKYKWFAIV